MATARSCSMSGVDREIEVILDLPRMQALGVTASQINGVLRQSNVDAAGGMAEVGGTRQSVRVLGNSEDAYALSQRQIQLGGGRTVKLAVQRKILCAKCEGSGSKRGRRVFKPFAFWVAGEGIEDTPLTPQ